MATTAQSPTAVAAPTAAREYRSTAPVYWWAVIGVIFLTVGTWALVGWIVSGDAHRTPVGPTPVPGWMTVAARIVEVLCVSGAAAAIYGFVLRPKRRFGRVGLDGYLCLAFLSTFWMDSFHNLFQPTATFNATFVNLGSWLGHVPLSLSPTAHRHAIPLLFLIPAYTFFFLLPAMAGCRIMAWVRGRYPQVGVPGMVAASFFALLAADMAFEIPALRLGLFSYPGGLRWATLFDGHYYQYPIHIGVQSALWWTILACLRTFRNDRGETVAERGISDLPLPGRKKAVLRYLALVGFASVAAQSYHLPAALIGLHAGPWPADVQNRSYLTNGLCGPGTDIPCPGPGVPIARKGRPRVDPGR